MSRKFGKFLLFSAVAGAAAYSTYYYLKSKEGTAVPANEAEGDDDFDDFSEDLDEDAGVTKERSYVSLNLDRAEAIASEAFHKAKEVIADSVQQVKDTVKSVTEGQSAHETSFTDLTALNKETDAENGSGDEEAPSGEKSSDESVSGEAAVEDGQAETAEAPGQAAASEASEEAPAEAAEGTVEEFFDDDKN